MFPAANDRATANYYETQIKTNARTIGKSRKPRFSRIEKAVQGCEAVEIFHAPKINSRLSGNSRLRTMMIQLAGLWLRHQPRSAATCRRLSKRFESLFRPEDRSELRPNAIDTQQHRRRGRRFGCSALSSASRSASTALICARTNSSRSRLAKRHDICRNLIRDWIRKYEAGDFDEDAAADLLQQYEGAARRQAGLGARVSKGGFEKRTAAEKRDYVRRCRPWPQHRRRMPARCLVPSFDGAFLSSDSKDALWAKFYTGDDDRAAVFRVKRLEGATACDP